MAKLLWDELDKRFFVAGVEKVFVTYKGRKIPWSGVKSISVSQSANKVEPLYFDGIVYRNIPSIGDTKAKINAYMYPENFEEINGLVTKRGVTLHNQPNYTPFNICWKTRSSNESEVIHILYNVTSTVSDVEYNTDTNTVNPHTMSWDLHTASYPTVSGSSYISIDSRKVSKEAFGDLELYLYGSNNIEPNIYDSDTIGDILSGTLGFDIIKRSSGLNTIRPDGSDITGSMSSGLYKIYPDSPMNKYKDTGLFKEY